MFFGTTRIKQETATQTNQTRTTKTEPKPKTTKYNQKTTSRTIKNNES
jgi:hypothetical protein